MKGQVYYRGIDFMTIVSSVIPIILKISDCVQCVSQLNHTWAVKTNKNMIRRLPRIV